MIEIKNKKATFDYFIEDTYECGIVLTGTEIKSIRKGSANLKDSYARIKNDERRERKLLLHKKEIYKMKNKVEKEGYSLIPVKLYLICGKAKILLGVAKGKKLYDKRQAIKEKDVRRNLEKFNKPY